MIAGTALPALALLLLAASSASLPARAQDAKMPAGHAMPMDGNAKGGAKESVEGAAMDGEAVTPPIALSDRHRSDSGFFLVSVRSAVQPIEINRLHRWTLHVDTAEGEPVSGATITIDGGMPLHDHGLPTAPRVTGEPDAGDYLVEGMKFQMPGHWTVTFSIDADAGRDTVTFDLML